MYLWTMFPMNRVMVSGTASDSDQTSTPVRWPVWVWSRSSWGCFVVLSCGCGQVSAGLQGKVVIAVAFDCVEQMIFWSDITQPSISRAQLRGGETSVVIAKGERLEHWFTSISAPLTSNIYFGFLVIYWDLFIQK